MASLVDPAASIQQLSTAQCRSPIVLIIRPALSAPGGHAAPRRKRSRVLFGATSYIRPRSPHIWPKLVFVMYETPPRHSRQKLFVFRQPELAGAKYSRAAIRSGKGRAVTSQLIGHAFVATTVLIALALLGSAIFVVLG